MVFFTCGQCGEALKKAQVEKHFMTRCRQNNVFSCIDCGKDFWGKDYEQHTKCISEEEKYSGKNFVPKANANKGEAKQQQWLQQVQTAIDKVKANPQLRDLLERMKDYPNIPRKKAKFENFLRNSLRVRNPGLMAQVWDLIMAHTEKPQSTQNGSAKTEKENQSTLNNSATSQNSETGENKQTFDNQLNDKQCTDTKDVKKLNKREKKEERRKQNQKMEKKHKHCNGVDNDNDIKNEPQSDRKSKKKKKRKHDDDEEEVEDSSPGKRKRSEVLDEEQLNGVSEPDQTVDDEEEESEPPQKKYKTKFDWGGVMHKVIKKKGEISVKKLRKKVLAEYLSQGCTEKTEEKLWAKFNKKLKKNPTLKVLKDRVKLVT